MIEASPLAWTLMLAFMAGASLAGISLARLVPWTEDAQATGLPLAAGLSFGPLLLGIAAVIALAVAPGGLAAAHFGITALVLAVVAAPGLLARRTTRLIARTAPGNPHPRPAAPRTPMIVLGIFLALWVAALLAEALFIPLIQNDSLEYALVGRLLFEVRDIAAYPALDPSLGSSGFYGPWTHPPLYPALIYLTFLAQGEAETPALMRLLSPWAMLCGTALIYAMAARRDRLTGLLAALVFVSTPLFVLGAASGLLDAFAVLGLALTLAVAISVAGGPLVRGAAIGAAMGLGMWTHSQAILLVPLGLTMIVALRGLDRPAALGKEVAAALLVAAALAAWPYWRNYNIYGSLISDTPVVFALPSLNWDDYFRYARSIDTWANRIQYGIFKGWFAFEAYALTFWFMTVGLVVYMAHLLRPPARQALLRGRFASLPDPWLFAALATLACYLGGGVVSTLAGIDLMIRNERYMLLILPPVAVFAGVGLRALLAGPSWMPGLLRPGFSGLVILGLAVMLTGMLFAIGGHRWRALDIGLADAFMPQQEKLKRWSPYNAVAHLARETPPDALVLSMKPADMYYAKRRMLSYLDPAMVPFYGLETPEAARAWLHQKGVTHIHVPNYFLPPIYNSQLMTLIADPALSDLVFDDDYHQVYTLHQVEKPQMPATTESAFSEWTTTRQPAIGGRYMPFRLWLISELGKNGGIHAEPLLIFQRDFINTTVSATAVDLSNPITSFDLPVNSDEVFVRLQISGQGFVQVRLAQYNSEGAWINKNKELFSEIALSIDLPERTIVRRFHADPKARYARIAIDVRSSQWFVVRKAYLIQRR